MKKSNKRALILSLISILICLTMLIGSTFAWFTDQKCTSVNTIQAGTLKIDIIDAAANTSVVGQTLNFKKAENAPNDEQVLWEPGCTYELPAIKIKNIGNLALKYKIVISGIAGDAELNNAIEWNIKIGDTALDLANNEFHLLPNAVSDALTISGHMKEEAGNEYQGLSIEGVSICVYATQDTVEYDSTTNQYDALAPIPEPVSTSEELAAALNSSDTKSIIITKDLTNDPDGFIYLPQNTDGSSGSFATIPAGAKKTINLNGHTLKFKTRHITKNGSYAVIRNEGELTLTNTAVQSGTIELTHDGQPMEEVALSAVIWTTNGTVNIGEGVNIKHNGRENPESGGYLMMYAIDTIVNNSSPVVNVTGGTLESPDMGIRMFNTGSGGVGTLNISGGTIKGASRGIWLQHYGNTANLNITGGKIESDGHGVLVDGCQDYWANYYADNSGEDPKAHPEQLAAKLAAEDFKINVNITGGELISHMSARQDNENNVMCIGALSVYRGWEDEYAEKITLNVDENLLINNDGGFRYVIFKGYYVPVSTVPVIETTEEP